jgi:hypothetical protein
MSFLFYFSSNLVLAKSKNLMQFGEIFNVLSVNLIQIVEASY